MQRHRTFALMAFWLCVASAGYSFPRSERERWTLWPGESYTYSSVTVTWQVDAADQAVAGYLGRLRFKGPRKTLDDINPPIERIVGPADETAPEEPEGAKEGMDKPGPYILRGRGRVVVYLDEALFHVTPRIAGPAASLEFIGEQYPSRLTFDARKDAGVVYVSNICPLHLNQWQLTISGKPVKYPDGTEYIEITALDTVSKTRKTMPLTTGAGRRFGRFEISVGEVYEPTHTAGLSLDIAPDKTIQGGETWVDEMTIEPGTFDEILDRFGKQFGFQVEWVAYPGHPESIAYAKKLRRPQAWRGGRQLVKDLLAKGFSSSLAFEWKDPAHVQVTSTEYERVLEQKEIEESRIRREAERVEQRKAWEDKFKAKCLLQTQIYELKYMAPSAAKSLIEPELSAFYLIPSTPDDYRILSQRTVGAVSPNDALLTAVERCAVDDRTHVVIVSAVPSTFDRVDALIQELDRPSDRPGPPERYRIEVILLQGGKAGERVASKSKATPLSFRVRGVVEKIAVKAGDRVKPNDVIAALDSADQALELKRLETNLKATMTAVEGAKNSYEQAKRLHETGVTALSELDRTRAELETLSSQVQACEIELERARMQYERCTLRAPEAGVIASIDVNLHQMVDPGKAVVTLVPDARAKEEERTQAAVFSPELATGLGISEADLKLFGFSGVAQLGRGFVNLLAEPGQTGRALISLSESYRCELEFQDVRPPYVIVQGRLLAAKDDKPLLENTLFLEKGKPSLLGLTNLQEALILVLRLHGDAKEIRAASDGAEAPSLTRRRGTGGP